MTVVCPSGHLSATSDYCDQCGAPIPLVAASAPAIVSLPEVEEADTSPALPKRPCPVCGAGRSGEDRYCEDCGHDFLTPPAPAATWEAVATPNRDQFERLAVTGLTFPADRPERHFALDGSELHIGRSRGRPGEAIPEIDLAGPADDPGVSHLHAVLERRPDGTYAVRDLGSTNGTTINDDPQPLSTEEATPLAAGDRLRLGAWTTLTIQPALRSRAGPAPQS